MLRGADLKKKCDEIRANLPPGICPMPFISLIFNPDGKVSFCRERTSRDSIGDITTQSLEEIWNGEKIRAIRKEFLSGQFTSCASYIKNKHCNFQLDNQVFLPYTSFTEYQTALPLRISPDFNGQCNLKCIMCTIWQHPSGLYDQIGFWNQLTDEILPHLKFVDFLAGEPFIQKDTYRLIDLMYDRNPECSWRFTTNGHWRFNETIRKYLDKIKKIYGLTISLDAFTPETYKVIRGSERFQMVLQTVDSLLEYRKSRMSYLGDEEPFTIITTMAVQKANWKEVPDFLRWARRKGLQGELQFVTVPYELSLLDLDTEFRNEILDFFLNQTEYQDLLQSFSMLIPFLDSFEEKVFHQSINEILLRFPRAPQSIELAKTFERCVEAWLFALDKKVREDLIENILNESFRHCPASSFPHIKQVLMWLVTQLPDHKKKKYTKALSVFFLNN